MFELAADLPAELVPLSWLLGVWEGTGVVSYRVGERQREAEFGQRIAFTHDGGRRLAYSAVTWRLDDPDQRPYFAELGFWSLSRRLGNADAGPGMLPASEDPQYTTAAEVESLRSADGAGFDIEAAIVQDGGVIELYLGTVNGPRIDLGTDAVVRSASAKDYSAATRMYGLVEGHLLWAWDIAALGQSLRTHASGRLARVD